MNNNWLQEHRWNTTSQSGEDGVLAAIFDKVGTANCWAIECGAYNGKRYSNTWRLINEYNWNAVLIEGTSHYYKILRRRYFHNKKVNCINKMVGISNVDGLDVVLSKTNCPFNPDLCVIDIDGCDYWLWYYMTKYRPRVLMIEFNPTIPFWVRIISPIDLTSSLGSSIRAMSDLGKAKGYELVAVTNANAIFVTNDLFSKMGIEDNSLWMLARHTIKYITYAYQSFDNKIFFGGLDKRLWAKKQRLLRDLYVKEQ